MLPEEEWIEYRPMPAMFQKRHMNALAAALYRARPVQEADNPTAYDIYALKRDAWVQCTRQIIATIKADNPHCIVERFITACVAGNKPLARDTLTKEHINELTRS